MSKLRTYTLAAAKYLAITIFALYFLIWISSPFVSAYVIKTQLTPYGLQLHPDSHIRYNPFKTQISVETLSILKNDTAVFSLESGEFELDLYRLIVDDLHIDTLKLSGLYIFIELEDNITRVAGFQLPNTESNEELEASTQEAQSQESQPKASGELPFRISSDVITLTDHHIHIIQDGVALPFTIKELNVPPIEISTDSHIIATEIQASLFDGDLTAIIQASMQKELGKVEARLAVQNLDLKQVQDFLPNNIKNIDGKLNTTTQVTAEISGSDISLSGTNSSLSLQDFSLGVDDYNIRSQLFSLNMPNIGTTLKQGTPTNITAEIEHFSENLLVENTKTQSIELSYESLTLKNIETSANENLPESVNITLDSIDFTALETFRDVNESEKESPAVLKIGNLNIEKISATPTKADIETIHLSNIASHVFINKDKTIQNIKPSQKETLPEDRDTEAGSVDTTPPPKKDDNVAFLFSIKNILIDGNNVLNFSDESVNPSISQQVILDSFTFSNLSNTHDDQSPFTLTGRHNKHGKFNIEGGVAPFSEHVNSNIKGKITELSLPTISAYIHEPLGFELTSGQLDTNIDVQIKESELDGKIKLDIRGLTMSKTETYDEASLKEQTAVPLNVALGMLKDKRGNIKLKVPLSGSVEDPSFGVQSFLLLVTKKAILSQAKSYLMNTFVPYANVISVAMMAGDFALKLRFEDLIYEPTHTEISDNNLEFTQQFIQLMKDKPNTQIKVCGIATPEDLQLPLGKKAENIQEDVKAQLRVIATNRAETFKAYVIENGEIASSRLLVCAPKLEFGEKAKPRLELSI